MRCGIGQSEIRVLVDSGASMNFISKAQIERLGMTTCESSPITVTLADGQTMHSTHSVKGIVAIGPC